MTATLVSLPYSPWSEQARWALDHHRVPFREIEYVPMLGEPFLRLATRQFFGKVTVPTLFDRGRVICDSHAIARHAAQRGETHGDAWFPEGRDAELDRWTARAERINHAARSIAVPRISGATDALLDSMPGFIPRVVRGAMLPVAAVATRFLEGKYSLSHDENAHIACIETEMLALRDALTEGDFILGTFSWADVVMACAFQLWCPVADRFIPLGRASRRVYTNKALIEKFVDLVGWRDRMFSDFRAR